MVARRIEPELRKWVKDNMPEVTEAVRLELAGLDDFDVMFHMIQSAVITGLRSDALDITTPEGATKLSLIVADALDQLGFGR